MLVSFDLLHLILLDDQMTVGAYPFQRIFLDSIVLLFLRVDEDLLFALLVFKPNLVESVSALRRIALDRTLGFLVRQRVWRHRIAIVYSPGDDRLIRIAFQKIH